MLKDSPMFLFWYLLIVNLLALILFGIDKYRAQRHQYRIPEATLFTVAILGGSLGAWAGMYLFRHKTAHKRFVIGIPLILVVQIVVAVWYFVN
ncbi:MAG: DUF1294 domain-containing protein [Bacteroidales bacterium]|nr:DUF1294 domain-containing protein [Bacteroidales bacterium]